ncbi:ABC transporter permease subunit [Cytobacillus oceanisediminis]
MRRLMTPLVAMVVLAPLLPLALWSGSRSWPYPDLLPRQASTRGFGLLATAETGQALLTSLLVAGAVAALSCAIGLPAGRAIGLHRWRGRRLVQLLLVAPVIVPGIAVVLGLQVFFIRFGLSESVLGVILVQLVLGVPYAALVLGGAFETFDADLERQAHVLGAGSWRTTTSVTLPVLAPALSATAVLTFLISWSEYVLTLVVGGGQVQTLPLLLFATIGTADTQAAAALGLALVVPPVLLLLAVSGLLRARGGMLVGMARS